ncbi:MAG: DUF3267 domain-containing protein [Prolixibacteraceae bacterium]|nr:DUF3267 domain-containing protein [Prolixibacteraceae bacterium]
MNKKPSIKELHDSDKFELIAEVEYSRIKDFVLKFLFEDKKVVPAYMVYQMVMFIVGLFFFTRGIVFALRGSPIFLLVSFVGVVFSISFLVAFHELLHGIVQKFCGAPKVSFGRVPGKYIFYSEADKFVWGRRQYTLVALTPLIFVQIITFLGIIIFQDSHLFYFFMMVMCIHSFLCAGDVVMATVFYRFPGRNVYTFDNQKEKKSYYFVEKART